jgi:predicted nucleotidyltransferase
VTSFGNGELTCSLRPLAGVPPISGCSGRSPGGDDRAGSDIDFLVDFEASRSLVDVAGLILDLREILGAPVDVVEASTLRPGDADIVADAVALESA